MLEKIKYHKENKKYLKIYRKVSEDKVELSSGYVLSFSEDFILIQEIDDFKAEGFAIYPISQIERLRFNKADKYCDKIIHWEKEVDKMKMSCEIDLSSWQSIFKSLQSNNMNVIVECEDPEIDTFTIGPIVKVGRKYVYILYFDAQGFFDIESTSINFVLISKLSFDNQYINTISKYTRHKKINK